MRPDYIEVGLYGDGKLKETVVLNDLNNWSYTWNDLSTDVVWNVEEINVPDNYRMTSEKKSEIILPLPISLIVMVIAMKLQVQGINEDRILYYDICSFWGVAFGLCEAL